VVEAGEQELFDLRVPLRGRCGVDRVGDVGANRIGAQFITTDADYSKETNPVQAPAGYVVSGS
jgi:hypothetical protein